MYDFNNIGAKKMNPSQEAQPKEPLPVRCYSMWVGNGEDGQEYFLIATSYAEAVKKTILHCDLEDETDISGIRVMDGEAIQ